MPAHAIEQNLESVPESQPVSKREKELREAIERVYQKYGTDLARFYRDVQKDLEKRAIRETGAA